MFITKAEFDKKKAAVKAKIAPTVSITTTTGLRKSTDGSTITVEKEHISFSKYIRGGLFGIWRNADHEKRIFEKYEGKNVSKALGSTNQTRGGLFVPDEVSSVLIPRLEAEAKIRSMGCPVTKVAGFRAFKYPVQGTAPTITWGTESATLTADDNINFDPGTIESHKMTCLVYTSRELAADADIDIESVVQGDIVKQIALAEDQVVLRGLGGTQPLGLLYHPRVNSTDLSGEIDQDDITNAVYQVTKSNGIVNGWIGDPALAWKLSKLKDGEGRYIYPQEGKIGNTGQGITNLGGAPLKVTTTVGVGSYPGSNETFVVGGDWSKYMLIDGTAMRVEVTTEGGDAWTKDQLGLRVVKYFGGGPLQPATFVVIKGITGT